MTKMYKVVASLVLALACAGLPCMAKQPTSANSEKKSVLAKKSGKKKSKGRRALNKKRFWTAGRVVFAGLMTSAVAASAYWYFNQDQVSGWLTSIKEQFFGGDAVKDGLEELKKAAPTKAKALEEKFEKEKNKYATENKQLQESLNAKDKELKIVLEEKNKALEKQGVLEGQLKTAGNAGSVENASLKIQLEEQKKLVEKWSADCTKNAVEKTTLENAKLELDQNFKVAAQNLTDKITELNKVVEEKKQLKVNYDKLKTEKDTLQKTVDESKNAKLVQELEDKTNKLEIENKQLKKLTKPGRVKKYANKYANKAMNWFKHFGDDAKEEKINLDPEEKKPVEDKA